MTTLAMKMITLAQQTGCLLITDRVGATTNDHMNLRLMIISISKLIPRVMEDPLIDSAAVELSTK